MRELTRREMRILAFIDHHQGEAFGMRMIASVIGAREDEISHSLRWMRDEQLVDYAPGVRPTVLTAAGRRMLWPHGAA